MTKNKKPNIARIVYDAYPQSDLLPIDPKKDCPSLQTLLAKVSTEDIGDGLFRFLIIEIVEGGDSTLDGAIRVLERAKGDVDAVLQALRSNKHQHTKKWKCPDCGQVVDCSYEDLAEAGAPYCSDCDVEMEML
ncbi:hypothetical protein ACFL02_03820 [Planctomycetota bacterium]